MSPVNPPDELMVDAFLPSVRMLVAKELRRQGSSQGRIAAALGVTQASVSHYLSARTDEAYSSLAAFHVTREEADRYATLLTEDAKRNAAYAVETLGRIWTAMLGKGAVCDAHRGAVPALADCDYCIRAFVDRNDKERGALSEVAAAVRSIESSSAFGAAMPEVSVNLACLSGDSRSAEDVVAVPGRIVKVRGSAKAMRHPEFGASGHMARMLLLARTHDGSLRAAINLRYDGRMARVLRRLRLRVLEIGGYSGLERGDPTIGALRERLAGSKAAFDVVVDRGGRGIEPNVYFFGRDAAGVAALAISAAELYSAG